MENIESYGDLTEDELLEFLHEIESDDDNIQEIESNKSADESYDILPESSENAEIEARYGDDAWRPLNSRQVVLYGKEGQRNASIAANKANKQRLWGYKQDRINIQREAFNQEFIRLSDPLSKENIKLLISLLTSEHTRMIDKYAAFINKRLTVLLNPLIPRRLRLCRQFYPKSIRQCPGFLYKASEEFGQGKSFWAVPLIPYYFEQNKEQQALKEAKPEFLIAVDKAVANYHTHSEKRAEKEIQYASAIVQKKITTFFELLRYNPFWFKALYDHLLKTKLC